MSCGFQNAFYAQPIGQLSELSFIQTGISSLSSSVYAGVGSAIPF